MTSTVDSTGTRTSNRAVFIVSAVLVGVNLVVLLGGLVALADAAYYEHEADFQPADLWLPFAFLTWVQALVSGVVLVVWPRSRLVGLGILYGTVGTAIAIVGVYAAVFSSIGS